MTLLNEAKAVYVGGVAAQAVYLGADKVWPAAGPSVEMPPVTSGLMIFLDAGSAIVGGDGYVTAWPDLSGRNDHPRLTKLAGDGLRNDILTPTGKKAIHDAHAAAMGQKGTIVDWDHQISTTAGHLFFVLGKQSQAQSCFHAIGTGDDSYWLNWNVADGYPVVDNFGSSSRQSSPMGTLVGVDPVNGWYVGQTWTSSTQRGFMIDNINLYTGPPVAVSWSTRPSFFEAKNWSPGLRSSCAAILWYNRVLTEAEQKAVHDWMRATYVSTEPLPEPPEPPPFTTPTITQQIGDATTYGEVSMRRQTRAFANPTAAGATLLWISAQQTGSSAQNSPISIESITDNAGNVWSKIHSHYFKHNTTYGSTIDVWACLNAKSMQTATATFSGSDSWVPRNRGVLVEMQGTTGFDRLLAKDQVGYTAAGKGFPSGTLPSTSAGIAISAVSAAQEGTSFTASPSSPWVQLFSGNNSVLAGAAMRVITPAEAGPALTGASWTSSLNRSSCGLTVGPA